MHEYKIICDIIGYYFFVAQYLVDFDLVVYIILESIDETYIQK